MSTSSPPGASTPGTESEGGPLARVIERAVTERLDSDPVEATYLGDHARDGRLPDPSPGAVDQRAAGVRTLLAELEAVAIESSERDAAVDAAILRTALASELLELNEIREFEWNPMLHNPGAGVHSLVSRDFAPLGQRLAALAERLSAVPEYLHRARTRLDRMSRVHLDTAVSQLEGTVAMLDTELSDADPALAEARDQARAALVEHCDWLLARADSADRDPRLGESLFASKLALTLDTATDPVALLARAEADLDRVTELIVAQAGELAAAPHPDAGTVREVLAELARYAVDDTTILPLCRDALRSTTEFVRERELVTVYDDPIHVVEMPEIDRGVAAAYCRPNGPLEAAVLPTEFAVSPTPAGWTPAQVASFYREYNGHLLHNLTVHEAMPGHALQLMHVNRHRARTPVRAVWASGAFIEGWAAYTEQLMADHGYRTSVSARDGAALRMQQLKMQLRTIINTVLDIRFHCGDLDERAAMELMTGRGFQEEGEALGKWRRVELTSTQLCTYYVGYTEVSAAARDLRSAHPEWSEREVHDALLAHGSPPVRHLRTLLGLRAA